MYGVLSSIKKIFKRSMIMVFISLLIVNFFPVKLRSAPAFEPDSFFYSWLEDFLKQINYQSSYSEIYAHLKSKGFTDNEAASVSRAWAAGSVATNSLLSGVSSIFDGLIDSMKGKIVDIYLQTVDEAYFEERHGAGRGAGAGRSLNRVHRQDIEDIKYQFNQLFYNNIPVSGVDVNLPGTLSIMDFYTFLDTVWHDFVFKHHNYRKYSDWLDSEFDSRYWYADYGLREDAITKLLPLITSKPYVTYLDLEYHIFSWEYIEDSEVYSFGTDGYLTDSAFINGLKSIALDDYTGTVIPGIKALGYKWWYTYNNSISEIGYTYSPNDLNGIRGRLTDIKYYYVTMGDGGCACGASCSCNSGGTEVNNGDIINNLYLYGPTFNINNNYYYFTHNEPGSPNYMDDNNWFDEFLRVLKGLPSPEVEEIIPIDAFVDGGSTYIFNYYYDTKYVNNTNDYYTYTDHYKTEHFHDDTVYNEEYISNYTGENNFYGDIYGDIYSEGMPIEELLEALEELRGEVMTVNDITTYIQTIQRNHVIATNDANIKLTSLTQSIGEVKNDVTTINTNVLSLITKVDSFVLLVGEKIDYMVEALCEKLDAVDESQQERFKVIVLIISLILFIGMMFFVIWVCIQLWRLFWEHFIQVWF